MATALRPPATRDATGGIVSPEGSAIAPASIGTLPSLHLAGFNASVDAYAWASDPDPAARQMRLRFLSLLGSREAVRAVWARLLKGEVATLTAATGATRFCALHRDDREGWQFLTAPLPQAAGYHGMLVPESARFAAERADFLLLPRPGDDPAALHYRFLNRRLDLPLHPRWAPWLWDRALNSGEAVALEAHGIAAYRCAPNPDLIAADLSSAVVAGILRVPMHGTEGPIDGRA